MVLAARGRVPPVAPAAGSDGMGRVRGAPPRLDVDVPWTTGVDVDALPRTATRTRQGHRRSGVDPAAASRAGDADSVTSAGVFAAGSYLLTIPDSIAIQAVSPLTRASTRSRSPQPRGSQLALAIDA